MEDKFDFFNYPIGQYLENISCTLKKSPNGCLVLTAETGAGKSTVLPLSLLEKFDGKILMSEPRRIAVLGVANRLSEELNENCGDTVGYKIHLESKISDKTRIEVVTEGVLLRKLQKDPILEDYNLVILDEFHERSINTDLVLAFLKEALELRDNLFVIIMSATINSQKIVNYLGNGTPYLQIPGRLFPVEVFYDDKNTVSDVVIKEITKKEKGNILVFLPGIKEIRKYEDELKNLLQEHSNIEIYTLHSSVSLSQQKKLLRQSENGLRRIILSSAIAETSLTVPDVNIVIDSGLARVNRINLATGMDNLVTEIESEFSAEQRKGRAGRLMAGKCIRLWNSFDLRKKEIEPEILRTDLSNLVLECAERGVYLPENIKWLDEPSKSSWQVARELLILLGLVKQDGRITPKGKIVLNLGLSPRLGAIAIDGYLNKLDYSSILIKYSNYNSSSKEIQQLFLNDVENRLKKIDKKLIENDIKIIKNSSFLILSGFPDRVAKKLDEYSENKQEYQFYSGRKGVILGKNFEKNLWICAPEVLSGEKEVKIFEFETIPDNEINDWLKDKIIEEEKSFFDDGKLSKCLISRFGKIVLSEKKLPVSVDDYKYAWVNEIKEKGLEVLPLSEKTNKFIMRLKFYYQQKNKKFDENEICCKVDEWLLPFITGTKITEDNVYEGLRWFYNGSEIDEEVPEVIKLTNGSNFKVTYSFQNSPDDKTKLVIRPVLEVIIQRVFGCFKTPEICGMKVLLKLLSPASRPLQITDDLEGFWDGAWIEICKEMKGRYPKHNWDYKVFVE